MTLGQHHAQYDLLEDIEELTLSILALVEVGFVVHIHVDFVFELGQNAGVFPEFLAMDVVFIQQLAERNLVAPVSPGKRGNGDDRLEPVGFGRAVISQGFAIICSQIAHLYQRHQREDD